MSYLFTVNLFPQRCACTETWAGRKRLSFWATHSCNSPVAASWECRGAGGSSWWGCESRGYWRTAESSGRLGRRDSVALIINYRGPGFGRNEESSSGPPAQTHVHVCIYFPPSQLSITLFFCLVFLVTSLSSVSTICLKKNHLIFISAFKYFSNIFSISHLFLSSISILILVSLWVYVRYLFSI